MAHPKRRHSRARGRKRRTNWKIQLPNVVECPQCHQSRLPHHVCPNCGYYKGRKAMDVQEGA
jgi:large subunit ribosomal protein L32